MRLLVVLTLAAAVSLAATPALAQVWNEVGDAGDLPATAQVPTGTGALTAINGTIQPNDADMYCIYISDVDGFSATTCGGTTGDSQLWLFDADGMGITFNDDDPGGCGLQSTITGIYVPGPGQYYLAGSAYTWDAYSAAGEIWMDTPFGAERAPDGPGAASPITHWGDTGYYEGPYTIFLTGTTYCEFTPVEPSSWGVIKAMYR